MSYIIIMNGFTATGKSITAKKLSRYLENIDIYHSATIREELGLTPSKLGYEFDLRDPIFVEKISPLVYGEMARRAKKSFGKGKNVILDASYSFFWQRKHVYNIGQSLGVDVYILRCICRDEEEIKRRLGIRKNRKSPLDEAPAWRTYLSTFKYSEPVEKDRLPNGRKPKIIEYDSFEKTVKTFNIGDDNETAKRIIKWLKSTTQEKRKR